jgi:hypothetical protein
MDVISDKEDDEEEANETEDEKPKVRVATLV